MIEHFSTRQVQPSQRLDYWNELVGATFAGLTVDTDAISLNADMRVWNLGDISLVRPRSNDDRGKSHVSTAKIARRCDGLNKGGEPKLVAHILQSGESQLVHRGREMALRPGDLVLCHSDDYYRFDIDARHEVLVMEMDRSFADKAMRHLDDSIGRVISGRLAPTRMLHRFLLSLWSEGEASLGALSTASYEQVLLAMLSTCVNEGVQQERQPTESHVLLLARAKRLIAARFADADLSANIMASALGVSVRSLQMATAKAGTTPLNLLTEARLDHAAMELRTQPSKPITAIAFDCGFSDSGYFARRFQDRFGMTPSLYRQQ